MPMYLVRYDRLVFEPKELMIEAPTEQEAAEAALLSLKQIDTTWDDHLAEFSNFTATLWQPKEVQYRRNDPFVVKVASPREKAEQAEANRPDYGRLRSPEEVAAANYTLDLAPWFDMEPAIPATIVEIGDHLNTIVVVASFPSHPELATVGTFHVGLDGSKLDVVQILCRERKAGEYDDLPLAGAVKGVFEALVATHRRDLDLLRMNVAYVAEITLKPAAEVRAAVVG